MPVSSAPSPTRSKRSSTISKRSIHSTSPQSPIQALRFIDQLDFYLWQSSGNESVVLDSILPTTLHTESQVAWYRKLVSSAAPRKLTLSDIRRALLKDFGVDSKTTRKVLTRYNDEDYLRSQSFKLVMNYIDEIEGLKERIEKEDTAKILARWKRVLAKTEAKNAAAIREKEKEVAGLKRTVLELETAVRGLTSILGFPEEERGTLTERAFERYQEEVGDAAERFRAQLAIGGIKEQINRLPDSYRRHDSTIFTDELMNLIEPAPPSAERPLRQLLPNGANLMSVPPRVEGFEKHVQVHMDTKDHQIVEDRLGSSVLSG